MKRELDAIVPGDPVRERATKLPSRQALLENRLRDATTARDRAEAALAKTRRDLAAERQCADDLRRELGQAQRRARAAEERAKKLEGDATRVQFAKDTFERAVEMLDRNEQVLDQIRKGQR